MRNALGQFEAGHETKPNWGFQKGNKIGLGKAYCKGRRVSPNTEFKKGQIPFNKGKKMSLEQRKKLVENHKGMSGLNHSEEAKIKMSLARMGIKLSFRVRENMSKSKINFMMNNPSSRLGNRGNSGYRVINGRKQYFRSSWEANAARLLDFQKRKWVFEKKTFWFEKIRRGTRSYLPDFYLPDEDIFIEVKGWMDPKSATKLKRMNKYFPEVTVEVWGKEFFADLKRQGVQKLIDGWE